VRTSRPLGLVPGAFGLVGRGGLHCDYGELSEGSFQRLKVAIIGTGYVGLTTGVSMAYIGQRVVRIDRDASKIELLRSGRSRGNPVRLL